MKQPANLFDVVGPTLVLRHAVAGEVGSHFITEQPGHECKAACYRVNGKRLSIMCECGHIVHQHAGGRTWAGSWAEALVGTLPVGAPFVVEGVE